MHRRLGSLGVFVEVDGKYYLSEERLKQIQERRESGGGGWGGGGFGGRNSMISLRIARMTADVLLVLVLVVSLFFFSLELRIDAALVANT